MPEKKIFKYSMNAEPFVIEAPVSKRRQIEALIKGETPEDVDEAENEAEKILSDAAKQSEMILAEAFKRSKEAEDKFKEADLRTKVILQQTQEECDTIITETKARAEAEAKEICEQARQEGHDEGFKKGYEEGVETGRNDGEQAVRNEMKNEILQANAKAQKTIQDAKEQTAEYFIKAEDDVVKVVMQAVEKILPQHFLDVPQMILPVVREAIQYVRDQKEVKVHVEPESYDFVLMARSEFQSMLTDGTAILEVISDEALKPGDCVIETPNGGVDARLSTQLELLKDAIKSVLHQ